MNTDDRATPTWPQVARQAIESAVRGTEPSHLEPAETQEQSYGGIFVTLRKLGRLRGCMGLLDASRPLPDALREAAVTAALHDPRFPAVTTAELPDITIEVSILSESWPMANLDELECGRHGIIVRQGMLRGLFLPQVATEHHLDKETFLSRCCSEKAGLPANAWRDPKTEVLLFTADVFQE